MSQEVNFKISQQDIDKAIQLRKQYRQHFQQEPVFHNAANVLRQAESATSDNKDDSKKKKSNSVITRNKEALDALKSSLSALRSRNNKPGGSSFFRETVPVTDNESCIRALISMDYVDPKVGARANSVDNNASKTSLTVNLRPQNKESFKSARESFVKGSSVQISNSNDENGEDGAKILVKVTFNMNTDGIENGKSVLKDEFIPFIKNMVASTIGQDPSKGIDIQLVEQKQQQQQLVITFADYDADDETADPFKKIIQNISKATITGVGDRRYAPNFDTVAAPDVLRLATLRVETPHDVSKWVVNDDDDKSILSLLEGARVAFEAIIRDDSKNQLQNDLAKVMLENFSFSRMAKVAVSTIAPSLNREIGCHIHAAPFDLLFAKAVQDVGIAHRQAIVEKFGDDDDLASDKDKVKTLNDVFLSTSAPEELAAVFLARGTKLFGLTPAVIKRVLLVKMARDFAEGVKSNEGPLMELAPLVLKFKNVIGDLAGIDMLTPSASVKVTATGIDGAPFFRKLIPNSLQGVVDFIKPYSLASNEDWNDTTKKNARQQEQQEENEIPKVGDEVNLQFNSMKGFWLESTREVSSKIDPDDDFGVKTMLLNPRAFQLAQAPATSLEKSCWASPGGKIPQNLTRFEVKPKSHRENQEQEDEQEEHRPLLVKEQVEDSKGVSMTTCRRCGERYNASIPNAHSCGSSVETIVEISGGSPRPPLGKKSQKEEKTSVYLVICDRCSESYNASILNGHHCISKAVTPQQTVLEISGTALRPLVPVKPAAGSSPSNPRTGRYGVTSSSSGGAGANEGNNNSPSASARPSKNGRLFQRLGNSFTIPTDEKSLRNIFDTFDQNHDGKISKQEFVAEYREFEKAFGVPVSDRDINAKFKLADKNNDGSLSFKEFSYFMVARATQ
jgi:hypothetical protein